MVSTVVIQFKKHEEILSGSYFWVLVISIWELNGDISFTWKNMFMLLNLLKKYA